MAENSAAIRLSERLGIDVDSASALLIAADGDEETAVAVHIGYNGGDLETDLVATTEVHRVSFQRNQNT